MSHFVKNYYGIFNKGSRNLGKYQEFLAINSIIPNDSAYYEEELLFDPPPKEVRSRAHIEKILNVETKASDDQLNQATLKKLKKIYEESIVPLESTYKYKELSHR